MSSIVSEVPASARYSVATDRDWQDTIRQTLPELARVCRNLRPTWKLPHIDAIDAEFLQAAGVRALIWDVDGTLTTYHGGAIAAEVAHAVERLLRTENIGHAILSNCGESRFEELSRIFPRVPLIKGYQSAGGPLFRVRRGPHEHWSAEPLGRLTPIRKPHPALVEFALDVLGVRDRTAVAVIGDLYLTDVASANLAGVRSVKLPTLSPDTFPPSVRMLHVVDQLLHRLTRRR